jgi:hypothetical protein
MNIDYPKYLSIKNWKHFKSLDQGNNNDKMVDFISYLSGINTEEIKQLQPQEIQDTYITILETFKDIDAKFYPVIEIDGVLYGFNPISKITVGEYMDIERLAKDTEANMEEIMAILYRPIVKHSFGGIKWNVVKTFKIGFGEVENLFKYYQVEKYDSALRAERAEIMKHIPVSFAMGAMSFFLVLASSSLLSTQVSLPQNKKEKKQMMNQVKELLSVNIGDGLLQFITYLKLPSLQSQEIKVSQI